jgi:hypothetical protein
MIWISILKKNSLNVEYNLLSIIKQIIFIKSFKTTIFVPSDWTEILAYFRGSELQNYFTKILEDDLKAVIKPQYVDQVC